MNKKVEEHKICNLLKRLTDKDLFIITSVMYFALVIIYEMYYCNFEYFCKIIPQYNFSIYRVIVYIAIYLLMYKFKKKFIREAIEAFENNVKCYFVYSIGLLTVFITTLLIVLININQTINIKIIMLFISLLMFNLFSIYISKNIIKNAIITSLAFGTLFSISITFNNQLDEKIHFLSSYSIATGNANFEDTKMEKNIIKMPRMMGIRNFLHFFSEKPSIDEIKDFSDESIYDTPGEYRTLSYIISGIGIFISKTLGGSIADIYITGRIFNLLGYILLIVLALKTFPYKKHIALSIFFMPMLLALASVYSPDGISTAIVALFIAYCLKLHEKENISKKEILLLLILLTFASTIKSVGYIGIALIIFILPLKKIIKENKKYIKYILILFIVAISTVVLIYISRINQPGDPRSEGTSTIEQFKFVMSNPLEYAKILLKHTKITFTKLKTMSFLNAPMFFNKTYYILFIVMLTYLLFISITDSSKQLKIRDRLIFLLTFGVVFAMTSTAMYLSYTKVRANYIDGFQMRYIFPTLFLLLSIISIKKIELPNKFKYNYLYLNCISSIFLIISVLDVFL